jgi:hypothetical protein
MIEHLEQCKDLSNLDLLCIALKVNEFRNIIPILNNYKDLTNSVFVLGEEVVTYLRIIRYQSETLSNYMKLDRVKLLSIKNLSELSIINSVRRVLIASSTLTHNLYDVNSIFRTSSIFIVSHGLLSRSLNCPGQEWLQRKLEGKFRLFCPGNHDYEVYGSFGWDISKIEIIGMPIFQMAHELRLEILRKNQLNTLQNKQKINILYLAQDCPSATQLHNLIILSKLIAKNRNWQLTLRFHPVMKFVYDHMKKWAKENAVQVIISYPSAQDSLELIASQDIVVSHWSTGLIEAMILGKCYIPLMSSISENFLELPRVCTDLEEVEFLVKNLLSHEAFYRWTDIFFRYSGNYVNAVQLLVDKVNLPLI